MLRSILAYQGSKFKLLPSLLPHLSDATRVYDVFGGSATVSVNVKRSVYNDLDSNVTSLLDYVKHTPLDKLVDDYSKFVDHFGLSARNERGFLRLREYQRTVNQHPFVNFVLSKHSFCGLMRFNSSNGFNLKFGSRTYDMEANYSAFSDFHKKLQRIPIHNLSYLKFVEKTLRKFKYGEVYYFDPPYLASGAMIYGHGWREADEIKLLSLLDYLDSRGCKWVLSNVLEHRDFQNKILKRFCKKYNVYYPRFNTKGEGYILNRVATSGQNKTVEIIVRNF